MRRNGLGAGSFLLGILVGVVLIILIAFAVSTNSTVQLNGPNTNEPTATPNQLQREKPVETGPTVNINARQEWEQFVADLAAIPQAIVNWVRGLDHSGESSPNIIVVTPTP